MKIPRHVVSVLVLMLIAVATGLFFIGRESAEDQAVSNSKLRDPDRVDQIPVEQIEVTGVVVGDYRQENELSGFFLQQSESNKSSGRKGIFVQSDDSEQLVVGDRVRVTGVANAENGMLQIKPTAGRASVEIEKLEIGRAHV